LFAADVQPVRARRRAAAAAAVARPAPARVLFLILEPLDIE
jgi:hypothetical protein